MDGVPYISLYFIYWEVMWTNAWFSLRINYNKEIILIQGKMYEDNFKHVLKTWNNPLTKS